MPIPISTDAVTSAAAAVLPLIALTSSCADVGVVVFSFTTTSIRSPTTLTRGAILAPRSRRVTWIEMRFPSSPGVFAVNSTRRSLPLSKLEIAEAAPAPFKVRTSVTGNPEMSSDARPSSSSTRSNCCATGSLAAKSRRSWTVVGSGIALEASVSRVSVRKPVVPVARVVLVASWLPADKVDTITVGAAPPVNALAPSVNSATSVSAADPMNSIVTVESGSGPSVT